jgi:lipopolysaccharide transport system permease protein
VIGGLWAIVQPLFTMIIFSFFFGKLAGISGGGVPYPIFSYAGLLLWTYFTGALTAASGSMVASTSLITKVYFPRIIIPIAATITGILDYLVASTVLIALMLYFEITPTANILLVPITVILTWMLAMGMGFWLSAINVKYRDIGYVLPFFIQLMLFVTPVIYPSSIAPNFKLLLSLNPMTGIIDAHRAMILGGLPINWGSLGLSANPCFSHPIYSFSIFQKCRKILCRHYFRKNMSDIAIKVENISKKYEIGENKKYPTLRDKLVELPTRLFKGPKKTKEFWALKDVSFEVKKGEVVGIIGRNGAGKSTMLKILARITEPTSGKITMYGRVASMLEVGTGFNPELTGRENICLNGAIIGMTRQEIVAKFDDMSNFLGR